MIKLIFIIIAFLNLIIIQGCSPVAILASGGATTMVVAEGDKSFGTVVDDATIKLNLSAKFLKSENNIFLNVNANVNDGRVLLTGIVENQEIRIEAVKSVWEISGVKEVMNEINVGNKTTLKEYTSDLWITAQVKSLAAKTVGFRVLSYNFETIKGKVYIAGISSRPGQLEEIINTIKTVKGVKEIINYVTIKE
jgi:osmotically-inducible protein OsmY|tara:strand:- start:117 stop:698 length:582 start_codon:yes stop_codon:yes gene_type:complete